MLRWVLKWSIEVWHRVSYSAIREAERMDEACAASLVAEQDAML